ncbi:MAG: zinc ribbon domain-containing protein [Promethearchaeota archaeon]
MPPQKPQQRKVRLVARMITCKKCGWSFSNKNAACPSCGTPVGFMTPREMVEVLQFYVDLKGLYISPKESKEFIKEFKKKNRKWPTELDLATMAENYLRLTRIDAKALKKKGKDKKGAEVGKKGAKPEPLEAPVKKAKVGKKEKAEVAPPVTKAREKALGELHLEVPVEKMNYLLVGGITEDLKNLFGELETIHAAFATKQLRSNLKDLLKAGVLQIAGSFDSLAVFFGLGDRQAVAEGIEALPRDVAELVEELNSAIDPPVARKTAELGVIVDGDILAKIDELSLFYFTESRVIYRDTGGVTTVPYTSISGVELNYLPPRGGMGHGFSCSLRYSTKEGDKGEIKFQFPIFPLPIVPKGAVTSDVLSTWSMFSQIKFGSDLERLLKAKTDLGNKVKSTLKKAEDTAIKNILWLAEYYLKEGDSLAALIFATSGLWYATSREVKPKLLLQFTRTLEKAAGSLETGTLRGKLDEVRPELTEVRLADVKARMAEVKGSAAVTSQPGAEVPAAGQTVTPTPIPAPIEGPPEEIEAPAGAIETGGAAPLVCPSCNFKNPPDSRFCLECGTPLAQEHLIQPPKPESLISTLEGTAPTEIEAGSDVTGSPQKATSVDDVLAALRKKRGQAEKAISSSSSPAEESGSTPTTGTAAGRELGVARVKESKPESLLGAPPTGPADAVTPRNEPTPERPIEPSGVVCPKCGKENPEGSLFCLECGNKLGDA